MKRVFNRKTCQHHSPYFGTSLICGPEFTRSTAHASQSLSTTRFAAAVNSRPLPGTGRRAGDLDLGRNLSAGAAAFLAALLLDDPAIVKSVLTSCPLTVY